jgi:hypothetical protein
VPFAPQAAELPAGWALVDDMYLNNGPPSPPSPPPPPHCFFAGGLSLDRALDRPVGPTPVAHYYLNSGPPSHHGAARNRQALV